MSVIDQRADLQNLANIVCLYQGSLIVTCFTGEKSVTGQQRFAPWYLYHKARATPPVKNFSRPAVLPRARPAALRRLPDTLESRHAVLLAGHAPRRMKQVNISDPWYESVKAKVATFDGLRHWERCSEMRWG